MDGLGHSGGEVLDLEEALHLAYHQETEMMRSYMILAEKLDSIGLPELKHRLREFAEGNAKRSRQLEDELSRLMANEME